MCEAMERNELKGKQTPGKWRVDYFATLRLPYKYHVSDVQESDDEAKSNAVLIAEAGTVANETGMWPRDLVERAKELEAELASVRAPQRCIDLSAPTPRKTVGKTAKKK